MAIMTHAKFHFNWLMLTLIFGIWASEPPGPGERLKRPGLIGLSSTPSFSLHVAPSVKDKRVYTIVAKSLLPHITSVPNYWNIIYAKLFVK